MAEAVEWKHGNPKPFLGRSEGGFEQMMALKMMMRAEVGLVILVEGLRSRLGDDPAAATTEAE